MVSTDTIVSLELSTAIPHVLVGDSLPLSPTSSLVLPVNFDPNGKDIDGVLQEADVRMLVDTPPLDLNWDLLCDATTFKVSCPTA